LAGFFELHLVNKMSTILIKKVCTHCIAVKSHQKCEGVICKRCKNDKVACVREEKIPTDMQAAARFQKNNVDQAKVNKDIVLEIRKLVMAGLKRGEKKAMVDQYNLSYIAILRITTGQSWKDDEYKPEGWDEYLKNA
jgi:hypothetical protein